MRGRILKRVDVLRAMHTIALALNNEDGYYDWVIEGTPDCPSEDDLLYIAEDNNEWEEVTNHFYKVIKAYGKDGFYV